MPKKSILMLVTLTASCFGAMKRSAPEAPPAKKLHLFTEQGEPTPHQFNENDQYSINKQLFRAAATGSSTEIANLLDHGAQLDARDTRQMTPLHRAAKYGNKPAVQMLLSKNADKCARDAKKRAPYCVALQHGHLACARMLR